MNSGPMPPPVAADCVSPTELEVARLRTLQRAGRHGEALGASAALRASFPENRDGLLINAISLRHLKRIPEALAVLDRLERLHPRFSQTHQERGLCHVALKDAPKAIDSLLRAVNINPALSMSWSMLAGVYRLTGEEKNAATATAHVEVLKGLPPEVVTATSLFSDGDLAPAEALVRAFLIQNGDHPEAMRLLAKIGVAREVLDDAEVLLHAVLELVPDHRPARYEYAQTLVQRHKHQSAQHQIDQLLQHNPADLDYRSLAATIAVGLGEHDRAIALYEAMLVEAPDSPDLHLWLGHALKTVGRAPEAVEAYRKAAELRPSFGDAYWSLANLKLYRFSEAEIARMRLHEASSEIPVEDRVHLCFALGKAFEDRGDPSSSWPYYERGNALRRAESHYRPEVLEINTRNQIRICTPSFFHRRQGWGVTQQDPIFVVGLPRSGSTLLEQILASHSRVEGTQELSDVQGVVLELQGRDPDLDNPRYPAVLQDMGEEDFARLGEKYLADTAVYRSGKPFFIDKMPNNFRHIGLIQLMLPNARIIDARRDPISCCFSNLKQLFAQGQEFSYSVEDISRYYRTYLDLMDHWDAVLPGRVHRIYHEDVVADLEGTVRRLLEHCHLEFEPQCLEFHKTRRSVKTPSSEQVRQPIFTDGLDQWRNFEPWLGDLKVSLADVIARWRG